MGNFIELTAEDGVKISAYRADPTGSVRGAVLVAQEIFGVNSHVRNVCDGFAADGYRALAPALFDRYQKGIELGYEGDDRTRGIELKTQAAGTALLDVAAARAALASSGKVGMVGYCWGGYLTWMAAAKQAGLSCAVCYYGGGMLEAVGEKPRCPTIAHFGEKDAHIPVAGVRKFAAAHPEVEVFVYPADHGFNCDQRGSYDASAAKLARERTLAFFRKHIG
jgi:carboxymethylenebutenolidase